MRFLSMPIRLRRTLAYILISAVLVACDSAASATCQQGVRFAYVGLDNNVYYHDPCVRSDLILTRDADRSPWLDAYYFYEPSRAWSGTGDHLLVGRSGIASLIDLKSQTKWVVGNAENAVWSPSDTKLALYSAPISKWQSDGEILVIDLVAGKGERVYRGNAPFWLDEDRIGFFSTFFSDNGDARQQVTIASVTNTQAEDFTLRSSQELRQVVDAQVSPDGKRIVAHIPGTEYQANLMVFDFADNSLDTMNAWLVENTYKGKWPHSYAYQWKPQDGTLGICTQSDLATSIVDGPIDDGKVILWGDNFATTLENRCKFRSDLSWSPDGNYLAYIGQDTIGEFGNITIASSEGLLIVSENLVSSDGNPWTIQAGPWWSPDGAYLGVIVNNEICISRAPRESGSAVEFQCLVQGKEMAWRP